MAWTYFLELAESPTPSSPGCGRSPIVSFHRTGAVICCPECGRVTLSKPRSGMMCVRCGVRISKSRWISSQVDSRARISALRALARAWKAAEVGYFGKSSGLLGSYDPHSCSWKTSQLSLLGGESPWRGPLPRWGLMRGGVCYPLPMWERRTSGKGGGSWPTPTVHGNNNRAGISPKAGDGLATAVARSMLPTPNARDFRSGKGRAENGHSPQLPEVAGGMLNPPWVEWLMGFPIGWSELAPWVIPWFGKRRGRRSAASRGSRKSVKSFKAAPAGFAGHEMALHHRAGPGNGRARGGR